MSPRVSADGSPASPALWSVGLLLMLSDRFRAAVEEGNIGQAGELFNEQASFRSPVLFKPYEGREQVIKVLRAAELVLGSEGSFRYVHQLEDGHDRVAMLEFATQVAGKQVEGIDKLTFDEDGLITELKVLLRPASAVQIVGARMAEEFARVGLGPPGA
jgi:SnoaL-like domain